MIERAVYSIVAIVTAGILMYLFKSILNSYKENSNLKNAKLSNKLNDVSDKVDSLSDNIINVKDNLNNIKTDIAVVKVKQGDVVDIVDKRFNSIEKRIDHHEKLLISFGRVTVRD